MSTVHSTHLRERKGIMGGAGSLSGMGGVG